jgi:hypothetical protein
MDAANVDLKAFTDAFYHRLCFAQLNPVLDTLKYLRHETNVWFEVTTLLIPGENDSDAELHRAAEWFAENLGPDVPWHFRISRCSIDRTHQLRRSLVLARSRAQRGFTTFTLETSMTAMAAARGVPVAANCSSSAIGTSSTSGPSRMVAVDLVATKSLAFSKNNAGTGARGVCR